mgnify:CR=1 FL=1
MRIPKDLVPQKVVAEDLCVSLVTLWRARKSNLPNFPEPIVMKNMIFWRQKDLPRLEDALLRFRGRAEYEKQRRLEKAAAALSRVRGTAARKRARSRKPAQRDLFQGLPETGAEG